MHHDETSDRPTPNDSESNDTQVPRLLTAPQRSRSEATTWNWHAVKIYRGGQGPAVSFPEYARGDDATNTTTPPDSSS